MVPARRRFARLDLPVIVWAAVVGALLLLPGRAVRGIPPWLVWLGPFADELAHGGLFFVLGLLVYRSLRARPGLARPLALTLTACALYGLLLEIAQIWVPFREAEVTDLLADAAGAALAPIVLVRLARRAARPR